MYHQPIHEITEEEFNAHELIEECRVITDYVAAHPYPSYQAICESILRARQIQFIAEYGDENHLLCKRIYENFTNRDIVRECGFAINNRGGFTTMQANWYILCLHSPIRQSDNYLVRSATKLVESYWNGIGEWRI